jgi:hypothetical protein
MKELDCLEMFSDKNYYDLHEDLYYNMLWEKRYGWKHYYHKKVFQEFYEWECGSTGIDEPPTMDAGIYHEYIRTEKLEVLEFELGKYGFDSGYCVERRYGLWVTTENGMEYCWDFDIEKAPGIALNRNLVLEELGI